MFYAWDKILTSGYLWDYQVNRGDASSRIELPSFMTKSRSHEECIAKVSLHTVTTSTVKHHTFRILCGDFLHC